MDIETECRAAYRYFHDINDMAQAAAWSKLLPTAQDWDRWESENQE